MQIEDEDEEFIKKIKIPDYTILYQDLDSVKKDTESLTNTIENEKKLTNVQMKKIEENPKLLKDKILECIKIIKNRFSHMS